MNVNGNCYLNVKEVPCKNGDKIKMFSTKIGKEGKLYANVRFTKELNAKAQEMKESKSYELKIEEGFLSNDVYNDKDNLVVVVLKGTIVDSKDKKAKEDKPF